MRRRKQKTVTQATPKTFFDLELLLIDVQSLSVLSGCHQTYAVLTTSSSLGALTDP